VAVDSTAAVQLDDVTVRYGPSAALHDVTASFAFGAVGLLGPNGAGKSTLLKSLLGFLRPERGDLRVLGLDPRVSSREIRARVGFMPENDAHISGMSAVALVAYCAELAGLPRTEAIQRAHEVLHYVGLGEARYRTVDTYSAGMKQRIKLAQALVHDPDLLLLDEPTNGMDPRGRDDMLELIRDIAHNRGLHLILSSHLLPDVEYTCDQVVVLASGRVVAQGAITALKGRGGLMFEVRVKGDADRYASVLRSAGIECDGMEDDLLHVFVPEGRGARYLFELAAEHGVQVRHLRPSVPTLEDVFARALGDR
jgi:ABC-2 type transport system ATP-binding protein